jgi:hypothetical protein
MTFSAFSVVKPPAPFSSISPKGDAVHYHTSFGMVALFCFGTVVLGIELGRW